jgi:hypothetical protein
MLKKLLKFMKSCVVSGISRIAPRNTNRPVEYGTINPTEEILTYNLLIVPERDTVMVFPNEVPRYNWATSAKQEQELTEVFTRIEQEGFW